MRHARTDARRTITSTAIATTLLLWTGCAAGTAARSEIGGASSGARRIVGAWRLIQTASRPAGGTAEWDARPVPQGGVYVFSARHYSYFYVPTPAPRPQFADGNRPTDTERATAFGTFVAGAGTYTYDGRTVALRADFRKNPNEANGSVWRYEVERAEGDTLRLVFRDPPFLPGRDWRITLVRAD